MSGLLLVSMAQAATGDSISFAPWNGASFTASEEGEQIQAAVSGPLGKVGTIEMRAAIPVSLAGGSDLGVYGVDLKVGVSTANSQEDELREEAIDALVDLDPNVILAIQTTICNRAGSHPESCDVATIVDWLLTLKEEDLGAVRADLGQFRDAAATAQASHVAALTEAEQTAKAVATLAPGDPSLPDREADADAARRRVEAAALAVEVAERRAAQVEDLLAAVSSVADWVNATVSGQKASPLDEIAEGNLEETLGSVGLVASGEFERFEAYAGTDSPAAETWADDALSVGVDAQVFFTFHVAAGLTAKWNFSAAYARATDEATSRVLVTPPPATSNDAEGEVYVAWVGRAQIPVPLGGDQPVSYYPVFEAHLGVGDFLADTTDVEDDTPDLEARVIGGLRPTAPGPGLGVGLDLTQPRVGDPWKVLPMVYLSGELPDLTVRKSDG
ncbi:MAG: hypothetical protein ACOZNI_27215 [Myxococcota bacterium]